LDQRETDSLELCMNWLNEKYEFIVECILQAGAIMYDSSNNKKYYSKNGISIVSINNSNKTPKVNNSL